MQKYRAKLKYKIIHLINSKNYFKKIKNKNSIKNLIFCIKIIHFRHFLINSAIFWLFFIKIKYIKQKISILLFFIFVIIKQGVDCANIQINIKHK